MTTSPRRYGLSIQNPLRESFDVYLMDHHAAADRIFACSPDQKRQLLEDLFIQAPHAVARALALRYPWAEEAADEVEGVIEDMLPLG